VNHLFDDRHHPAGIDHGIEGVGPYFIFSVEIEHETTREDYTIGLVPAGEGWVFHPGDGIVAEPDESSATVVELVFLDDDQSHYYHWKAGKFEDAPDPMPITPEQFEAVKKAARDYAQAHMDEIEAEPWEDEEPEYDRDEYEDR